MDWSNPTPMDVTDGETVFGGRNVFAMMPPMEDIPEEYTRSRNEYNKFTTNWFFGGADARQLVAREGVNRGLALRHLKAVMSSWDQSHQHKTAAVAYLLDKWFTIIPQVES